MPKSSLSIIALISLTLTACSERKPKHVEIEDKRDGFGYSNKPKAPDFGEDKGADGKASLALEVSAEAIKLPEVKDGFVRYRLVYFITPVYETSGTMRFVGGRANVLLTDLPAGRQGDIRLEVLDGAKVQAQASLPDVELDAGQKTTSKLVLADPAATPAGGAGTDSLTVTSTSPATTAATGTPTASSVNIGSSTTTGTTTEPQTSRDTSVSTTALGTGASTSVTTGGATATDPIESWDGLRFQGNKRWKVRPLD